MADTASAVVFGRKSKHADAKVGQHWSRQVPSNVNTPRTVPTPPDVTISDCWEDRSALASLARPQIMVVPDTQD